MKKIVILSFLLLCYFNQFAQDLQCITSGVTANAEVISVLTSCDHHFGRSLAGTTNYNYDYSCASGTSWIGGEYIFYLDDVIKGTYTFTLSGFASDLDLFILSACDESMCLSGQGARRSSGREESVTIDLNDGQNVYLVVDAKFVTTAAFVLKIKCAGSVCEEYKSISCGKVYKDSNTSYDRDATDKVDHHNGCGAGNYEKKEVVYRLKTSYDPVTIDLHPLDKRDIDLFVYDDCNGALSNCLGASTISPRDESVYLASGASDSELFIAVDGKSHNVSYDTEGQYELAITCGEPCDQKATKITCNSVIHSTTKGRPNNASYYSCDGHHNKGHNWGPESVFEFTIDDTYDIEIDLEIASKSDLNLYLLKGNCSVTSCLASSKSEHPGKSEKIRKSLKKGKYYIVVEGFRGDAADFKLSLFGCGCSVDGELHCDDPINGTLAGATNSFTSVKGNCFDQLVYTNNEDRTYHFRAPETGTYEFKLSDFNYAMDLFITKDCADPNACVAFSTRGGRYDESIVLDMYGGESVLVVVDGLSDFANSKFRLEVECQKDEVPYPDDPESDPDDDPKEEEPDDDEDPDEEEPTEEEIPHLLGCGMTYSGTTKGMPSAFDRFDYTCYVSLSDFRGGESIVEFEKVSDDDIISLHVFHGESYNENLSLFVMDENFEEVPDCKGLNFRADKSIQNGQSIGEYYTDRSAPLPAGRYYAVLDGFNRKVASDFDLVLTCEDIDCTEVMGLPCGESLVPENSASGHNSQSTYQYKDQIFIGYTGPEKRYSFCLDSAQTITIDVYGLFGGDGQEGDVDAFLFSGSCDSLEMIAYSRNSGNEDEQIEAALEAGTYTLIVDGWRGNEATYSIKVNDCFATECGKKISRFAKKQVQPSFDIVEMEVHPNPFNNNLEVTISGQSGLYEVRIYDATGQFRSRQHVEVTSSKGTLELGSLVPRESGVYWIQVLSQDHQMTKRVVRL